MDAEAYTIAILAALMSGEFADTQQAIAIAENMPARRVMEVLLTTSLLARQYVLLFCSAHQLDPDELIAKMLEAHAYHGPTPNGA